MNKQIIEKEVLGTNVNGEKEATPMGPFYKIKDGEDYTMDTINELEALNNGAIKAHEEAIEILTSYNTALVEKKVLEREKYINDATGWIDFISKATMERLAAEFYWTAVVDSGGVLYCMEFLEQVVRYIDFHFDLDEEDSIDNIVNLLKNEWNMKTTELDKTIFRLIAREEGRHDIEYYQQKAKAEYYIG